MRKIDMLQMNYDASRELEGCTADALDQIARDLPGYARPTHDPNCASCIIGEATRAIAAHVLGPDHALARPLPPSPLSTIKAGLGT